MSTKVKVQITAKDMFRFQLYHNYTRFSGIFGLLIGLGLMALGVIDITNGNASASFIWFVCSFVIMVFPIQTMKNKSKLQVQRVEMFQHPVEYEFTEIGFTARQGEVEVTNEWNAIEKVVGTKRYLYFYMSRVRAIIFPKESMGDNYETILSLVREHMPAEKVKVK